MLQMLLVTAVAESSAINMNEARAAQLLEEARRTGSAENVNRARQAISGQREFRDDPQMAQPETQPGIDNFIDMVMGAAYGQENLKPRQGTANAGTSSADGPSGVQEVQNTAGTGDTSSSATQSSSGQAQTEGSDVDVEKAEAMVNQGYSIPQVLTAMGVTGAGAAMLTSALKDRQQRKATQQQTAQQAQQAAQSVKQSPDDADFNTLNEVMEPAEEAAPVDTPERQRVRKIEEIVKGGYSTQDAVRMLQDAGIDPKSPEIAGVIQRVLKGL
jgi:uncharacterized membrane protein YebE (DUF533 family)